nr:hypothetical protein [Nostoc sp. EkiNYC01]
MEVGPEEIIFQASRLERFCQLTKLVVVETIIDTSFSLRRNDFHSELCPIVADHELGTRPEMGYGSHSITGFGLGAVLQLMDGDSKLLGNRWGTPFSRDIMNLKEICSDFDCHTLSLCSLGSRFSNCRVSSPRESKVRCCRVWRACITFTILTFWPTCLGMLFVFLPGYFKEGLPLPHFEAP